MVWDFRFFLSVSFFYSLQRLSYCLSTHLLSLSLGHDEIESGQTSVENSAAKARADCCSEFCTQLHCEVQSHSYYWILPLSRLQPQTAHAS